MSSLKAIPEIKGHWLLGSLKADPFLALCDWQKEQGDLVSFKLAGRQYYLISNAKWVENTLIKHSDVFVKMYDPLKPKGLALILGNGLVTSQGDLWRRQRRLIQPVFQRSNLSSMMPKMVSAGENMLTRWKLLEGGTQVNLSDEMMRLTLEVITQTMFSTSVLDNVDSISPALETGLRYALKSASNPLTPPFKQACFVLDKIVYDMIEQRRQQPSSNDDLLDMLLHARDENTGQQMSDQQIRDEVITIFTAGHETTANLLTWTLYLLAKHPAILKKLRSELEFLNGKTPTAENLQQLNYSRAVLNESLRIRPPVGMIMRKVNTDTEIEGYTFKSGSLVIYSIYNIHHNKALWTDPEQFQPERFLSDKNNRFSFLPFGTGERICIGNHFAMLESQLLLSMIIQKYDIQLTSDKEVEIDLAVSLRPKGGIPVLLRRR
jgi:cytochrome P450